MATKSLYDVLEVPRTASAAAIQTAYAALSERVKVRAVRDPQGAAVYAASIGEAHKILSNAELKRSYDARLVAAVAPRVIEDDRPWFVRHALLLAFGAALAIGAYGYHVHQKKEREAVEAALREKEALLAKQQADREAAERRRAEILEERSKMVEQANYQRWSEQARREGTINRMRNEAAQAQAEREAQREQRVEEMNRQREESQARLRLEQDKRRLQQLEAENSRRR